jgi:drug/metabolite transporter (DMT)-like permease
VSPRATLWLALWAVYLIWGSTYLGIALAGETIPPVFAAGARFVLAGLLMAGIVLWRRGWAPFRIGRAELASAAVVGLLLPGANAILFVAERDVPTGLASLVIGSVPLWIVLLRTIARDRPNTAAVAGTVVGFAGLALLVRPQGGATLGGMLLVLASAIAWSLGSFLSARLPLPADALAATTVEMLVGGLVLLPVGVALAVADGESLDPSTFSARSIGGFVYLVVFGSLIGYTAYVWLLANAPIGTVATYAYVNPIVAIALGALVLDEAITWTIAAGAVLVLASVAVVIRQDADAVTSFEPDAGVPVHERARAAASER